MSLESDRDGRDTHRVRQIVAATVCAESIVIIVYGFVLGIETLVRRPATFVGASFLALLVVLLGAGVACVCVGLWRGQRWARSPALVWQALQVALAVPALGPRPQIGVPLLVSAVLVMVGLFAPGVVEELPDGRMPLDED